MGRNATSLVAVFVVVTASCAKDAAPSAVNDAAVSADSEPPLPVVRDDSANLLFSFVDVNGRMVSVPVVAAVPDSAKKRVLVVDLTKTPQERQAHRFALFADLSAKDAAGNYPVVVVSRYDAGAAARAAASVDLVAPVDGSVVVYSATWCGYCKKAKAWLKQHDVAFVERDVEKTPGAQEELQQKLAAAHLPGGGIPVVDFGGGNLVVGFDVAAFERLTAKQ